MKRQRLARCLLALGILVLGGCATSPSTHKVAGGAGRSNEHGYYKIGQPYEIDGVVYTPAEDYTYDETGIASWYGPDFHGLRTANGELYDMNQVTAAHKTLPMPSLARVTNLTNGRQIIVRVNDRGPFARGRILDLSRRGAQLLGFEKAGTAKVRVQIMARESMALAEAAKQGQLTIDVAGIDPDQAPPPPPGTPGYTRTPAPTSQPPVAADQPFPRAGPPPMTPPPPPAVAVVDEKATLQREVAKPVKGEDVRGMFEPAPVVSEVRKVGPSHIYIQAGAFGVQENAERLRGRLVALGKTDISTALVGGRTFYRVRVGPVATVDQADRLLNQVVAAGADQAKIIVD
jgi:rare lipoprotein A